MILSPEVASKIQIFREKARAGTLTQAEMREAVALYRQDRMTASVVSETAKKKQAKKEIPSADDLLAEFGSGE